MRKFRINSNIPTPKKYTAFPNQITTKNYNQEVDFQSKRRLKHLKSLPHLAAYASDVQDTLVDSSFCLYKKGQEESCSLKHHDIKEHFVSYPKKKKKASSAFMKRSRSDVAKRVVIDESRNIVRRIESDFDPSDNTDQEMDYDTDHREESGKNKYENMSNEELNRRVEDFIQQFNMQIRP